MLTFWLTGIGFSSITYDKINNTFASLVDPSMVNHEVSIEILFVINIHKGTFDHGFFGHGLFA